MCNDAKARLIQEHSAQARNISGFTLLEVTIAVAIAALALVAMFQAGSTGLFAVNSAARIDEAVEREHGEDGGGAPRGDHRDQVADKGAANAETGQVVGGREGRLRLCISAHRESNVTPRPRFHPSREGHPAGTSP